MTIALPGLDIVGCILSFYSYMVVFPVYIFLQLHGCYSCIYIPTINCVKDILGKFCPLLFPELTWCGAGSIFLV